MSYKQDSQRLKQATQKTEEKVELTFQEEAIYNECYQYFREFGILKYNVWWKMFDLQTDPDLLQVLLGDVQDRLTDGWIDRSPHDLAKSLIEDRAKFDAFYEKISKYWRQERPIPDAWKKEVIPGLTVHEAISNIIPKAVSLKEAGTEVTVKSISEILGLTYQQTYLQLMPYVKPVLDELRV
jgi:hypothetical protein